MSIQYGGNAENNAALVLSLIIKSEDAAIQINHKIENNNGLHIDEYDKTTWKYYLNISGVKHTTNNTVYVKSIDNGSIIELTKSNMALNPLTHKELLKFSTTYNDLIIKNPYDELYIRGIILPVDINKAIEAVDGSILNYSHLLIENQELDIIKDLNTYSEDFTYRWRNKFYGLIDDLFNSAFMGILISNLLIKLDNLRIANIGTYKANTYYINEFFNSNMSLKTNMEYLNEKSRLWVYLNFNTLKKRVGSNRTLNNLIKGVLTTNEIGSARINISKSLPQLTLDSIENPTLSQYTYKDTNAITIADNQYIEKPLGNKNTLNSLVASEFNELKNDFFNEYSNDYIEDVLIQANNTGNNDIRTKAINLRYGYLKDFDNKVKIKTRIDNFFILSNNNNYTGVIDVTDINTGVIYSLSPYTAMLFLIKLTAIITSGDINTNPYITSYTSNGTSPVRYADITEATSVLLNNIPNTEGLNSFVNKILVKLPYLYSDPTLLNVDDFESYIRTIYDTKTYVKGIISNNVEPYIEDQIKIIFERCWDYDSTIVFNKNIDTLLREANLTFIATTGYDPTSLIDTISKTFMGIMASSNESYTIVNAYKELLTKMSSYSTQYINDSKNKGTITIENTNLSATASVRGASRIMEARFYPLDPFDGTLNTINLKFLEDVIYENGGVKIRVDTDRDSLKMTTKYSSVTNDINTILGGEYKPLTIVQAIV